MVVVDGLMPKFVSDHQHNILVKAIHTWQRMSCSNELFNDLMDTYNGSRCFMTEIVNAALETKTDYFVSPYFSSPQMVYFFRQGVVQVCAGSLSCLCFEAPRVDKDLPDLTQIIVDFDLEEGSFSFVDKDDLAAAMVEN